jgi:MFS family permease
MADAVNADEEKTVGGRPPPPNVERTISNIDAPIPHHDHETFDPPDGGWRAWSQILAALCINCIVWGYPSTFGVFQLHYVETLGLPSAQVSWIGSIQIFLTFAICSVSGRLADAGYSRHTVAVGTFLAVLGTFMTSLATEYWQILLAQGICTGLGSGIAFMPAVAVASSYFKRNRAFALAIAAVGTSIGSLIFPSIVQYLIPKVGFPWAVRCEAFVALVISVIANLLLKPYLPPRKAGPLLEWGAFKELPYVFFALGGFLNLYLLYFGFFYVSVTCPIREKRLS